MWKKIASLLFVLIIISSLSSIVHADDESILKYQVILPEKAVTLHKNMVILVYGKAPVDKGITIVLFGIIDFTGNKYSLVNLPEEEDYTLLSVVDTNSGPLGFAEEIELINGINKIQRSVFNSLHLQNFTLVLLMFTFNK